MNSMQDVCQGNIHVAVTLTDWLRDTKIYTIRLNIQRWKQGCPPVSSAGTPARSWIRRKGRESDARGVKDPA
eukprot:COSAG02_NODE_53720_length_300_cov_0.691542_1_plen_71_part_10